jgi:hypothetical protein
VNEFRSRDFLAIGVRDCAIRSYIAKQVNDVVLLLQASEERLNTWKHRCCCCSVISPIIARILRNRPLRRSSNRLSKAQTKTFVPWPSSLSVRNQSKMPIFHSPVRTASITVENRRLLRTGQLVTWRSTVANAGRSAGRVNYL